MNVQVPDATVEDLLDALGHSAGGARAGVVADGRLLHTYLALGEAELHDGAVIELSGERERAPAHTVNGPVLAVVGGVDAGQRFPLRAGRTLIGRGPGCDVVLSSPTVSSRHAVLEIDGAGMVVEDLGSTNGVVIGGNRVRGRAPLTPGEIVSMGAVQLTVLQSEETPAPLGVRRTAGGNIPFNRPPRSLAAAATEAVALPAPPREAPARPPFSWLAMLVPLVFAGGMAIVAGNVLFALFALLSPVMLVANWYEGRRQGRRVSRQEATRFAADLADFAARLERERDRAGVQARAELPDPAEVLHRAKAPSVRLWERRPADPDFLRLSAGLGTVGWRPPLTNAQEKQPPEVTKLVAENSALEVAPVPVDLSDGGVVGIAGERDAALALARSLLCQAAVHHGPADLRVMVLTEPAATGVWDWTKWLPHTRDAVAGGGARMLADQADQAEELLGELLQAGRQVRDRHHEDGRAPMLLMVVDAVALTEGKNAPVRAALRGEAGPVAGIVLAPSPDRLPAMCTTVIEVLDAQGRASLAQPRLGERVNDFLVAGVSVETARSCALALARFEDPETATVGASLPSRVDLAALFTEDVFDPATLAELWRTDDQDPGLAAPIGMSEDGTLVLDLLTDGPHGLVGGTTGSGKSELLRSLVAGLALRTSPEYLNFVLIDYKGGSAFDECARLPHTVGLVTDLDAELGERALRCLEAELRYRERVLREAGVDDLRAYLRQPVAGRTPLPRLLVVIDEFATMAAELPEFMDALVGVAQRGRSLGVHLLLATQRPSGAVKDNIRANTNLRIALRVQDDGDSTDVIGTSDAARIGRDQPGRAFVRLGPSDVVPIQTALVTGLSRRHGGRVDVAPFRFGRRPRPAHPATVIGKVGAEPASDLQRIVAAARAAYDASSLPAPRRPWPEPLPEDLSLDTVTSPETVKAGTALVALADDPDAQAQYPVGWKLREGNLLMYGMAGSGTTTALGSIALALAAGATPDELHLYVLDFGAGELAPLAELPHTGAVITATEDERQRRLIRVLRGELDRRRELGAAARDEPLVVLLIDGLSALRAQYGEPALQWVQDELTRVVSEGPALGLLTVITADRVGAVPTALSSTVSQKWMFRLADPYDQALFGLKLRGSTALPPGRAVITDTGQLIHIGRPTPSLGEAIERIAAAAPEPVRPPMRLGILPTSVRPEELGASVRVDSEPWLLPVGIAEHTLAPAALPVYPGEHVLIAGPARSGRSGLLRAIADMLAEATPPVSLTVVASRKSSPRRWDGVGRVVTDPKDLPGVLAELTNSGTRQVLLIDDAETLDDPGGAIQTLLSRSLPDVHVIAAGRADLLRTSYGHWTQIVRRSGTGVLLRPDVDFDGDLLAVRLPRRPPVPVTVARGWLVHSGEAQFIQATTVQ